MYFGKALNALACRRRSAIKFLEDEFDRPQKRQQAEIRNDMNSRFPDWWKGQTQAAYIDERQLLQRVRGWLSSYAAARKKAAVEQI